MDLTHITSGVAFANALYSASVPDLDTVACFLAHHEIKFGPRNMENPPVDLLSSTHPAQTESEKALTNVDDDLLKVKPSPKVPFTYLSMRLATVQCDVVGACRNWQTLFTAKQISGRDKVKY